jgi:hypothetical protein
MGNDWFLGIVEGERLKVLSSEAVAGGSYRLARSDRGVGVPEDAELSLGALEGAVVMVRGIAGDGWIHSATITDHAGPIVTALARRLYGEST